MPWVPEVGQIQPVKGFLLAHQVVDAEDAECLVKTSNRFAIDSSKL